MTTAERLYEEAMQLPAEEREWLTIRLVETQDEGDLSPEWREEIARRMQAIEDGTATLIPWDDAMARIFPDLDPAERP